MDGVSQAEPHRIPEGEVPEGMRQDARETWPSHDLIESWLGESMYDFQFRPGEDVLLDEDDTEAIAAAREFREVLGRFASGVTVVTAMSGGAPVGLTCQSFSSVSLNPPLVLFVPAKTSRAWPAIQRSGKFCVNFLAADQAELSNQMASKGVDKFAGVGWSPAPATGSPLIDDTLENDWQVRPAGAPPLIAVTTVTPEANRPSTSRNIRAAATASASSASTTTSSPGRSWKSYIESPSQDSMRSWLGQVSRASCFMPSGISASMRFTLCPTGLRRRRDPSTRPRWTPARPSGRRRR